MCDGLLVHSDQPVERHLAVNLYDIPANPSLNLLNTSALPTTVLPLISKILASWRSLR